MIDLNRSLKNRDKRVPARPGLGQKVGLDGYEVWADEILTLESESQGVLPGTPLLGHVFLDPAMSGARTGERLPLLDWPVCPQRRDRARPQLKSKRPGRVGLSMSVFADVLLPLYRTAQGILKKEQI